MSENPWHCLPDEPPFVLLKDKEKVEAFNAKHPNRSLCLELIPGLFTGKRGAPVVLLGNIATASSGDITAEEVRACYRTPAWAKEMRRNLLHQTPILWLIPDLDTPGKRFWKPKVQHLLDEFGESTLAQRIMTIEFFPYRSYRSYDPALDRLCLPSQEYTRWLVQDAMKQNKVIVLRCGKRRWFKAVPELGEHKRLVWLKTRNPVISERNCGGAGYQEIVRAIRAAGELTDAERHELDELRSRLQATPCSPCRNPGPPAG